MRYIAFCMAALMLLLSLAACSGGEEGPVTQQTVATLPPSANVTTTAPQVAQSTTQAAVTTTEAVTTTTATAPLGDTTLGGQIAALANTLLGKPFVFGAIGPNAFDNSGFVYYCYGQQGIVLPRVTDDMYAGGTAITEEELRPGDLVFYTMSEPGSPDYVGIYIGNREFVACSNEDRPVDVFGMDWQYFAELYVGARRYT